MKCVNCTHSGEDHPDGRCHGVTKYPSGDWHCTCVHYIPLKESQSKSWTNNVTKSDKTVPGV